MASTGLAEHLVELEGGLEGLLACFEAQTLPEEDATDAAWARVTRAFERVRIEWPADGSERDGAEREVHRDALERCQRLHAIATSLLARRRDEVAIERTACRAARSRLQRAGPIGENGGSCDVRG